jgi:hypothetical protein
MHVTVLEPSRHQMRHPRAHQNAAAARDVVNGPVPCSGSALRRGYTVTQLSIWLFGELMRRTAPVVLTRLRAEI